MSDVGEVWVRIPRELFNDVRVVLRDAADDLSAVAKRSPLDPAPTETAIRLRLAEAEMNRTGAGVLVNKKRSV
jgi:hypothetical protein